MKAHFLTGNYEKAYELVQGVLKLQAKNVEGLYWQGMLGFYTYRLESADKAKIAKAKQAESCLLGIMWHIKFGRRA